MSHEPFVQLGPHILQGEKISALDIGGAKGIQPHWRGFIGNSNFVMFEPHPESFQELQEMHGNDPSYHIIQTALSGTGGARTFYQTNSRTASSLCKPDADSKYVEERRNAFFPMTEHTIQTSTLEDTLNAENIPNVDVMNIDVQGAELEVLRGLDQSRMDKVLSVEGEVGLTNSYKNMTNFNDWHDFMTKNDMLLYDVRCTRLIRKLPGGEQSYNEVRFGVGDRDTSMASRIHEFDALYFRNPDPLMESKDSTALRKLIFTMSVHCFFADALCLVEKGHSLGVFTLDEAKILTQALFGLHRFNKERLQEYEASLKPTKNRVWAQYAWFPYPSF